MNRPERIVVIGMSGAGKTSVARQLAARMDVPHTELDSLFWGPDWTPVAASEFHELARCAVAGERWVVDGNYSRVRDIVWPRAQMIVWLNLPFATVFSRVLVRTLRRATTGATLWKGNRESLARTFFSRESILLWVLQNYHQRQRDFAALKASGQFAHLQWVELVRPAQVREFVEGWQ